LWRRMLEVFLILLDYCKPFATWDRHEYRISASNWATIASFLILSSSLFTNNLIIWRYGQSR
jgi:hypothetical protein